jgi:hypothetical protein
MRSPERGAPEVPPEAGKAYGRAAAGRVGILRGYAGEGFAQ